MKNKIILAPMAGVTDFSFRAICKEYGADIVYSEMVSAKAIHFKDKKTKELLKTDESEAPLIVQIFGSDPVVMSETAKFLEDSGVSAIDINMGCPTPKIVNNGDGCALMKNPDLVSKVVSEVANAVKIPVSVKIRSGWDENNINASLIAKNCEQNGAKAIAVHPRTKMQGYSGKADWNVIKEVKDTVKIPVIGNGDITSSQDAFKMLNETGCDSIMIGRASLGNPFLFREIASSLSKKEYTPVSDREKKSVILKHLDLITESRGMKIGLLEFRKHIAWYLKGRKNSTALKSRAFCSRDYSEFKEIIDKMFEGDYLC